MSIFTLGCDPEFFVRDSFGNLVTAHGLIPGDKKKPHKVTLGAIQVDGMALEINIDPVPASDFEAFNKGIITVVNGLKKAMPADHTIVVDPSVTFDAAYYAGVPEEAKELGCDPDFCAYTEDFFEPNPRPDGPPGLRSAAGHIHIGWGQDIPVENPEHVEICRNVVRNLDCFVGLGMICIDGDAERRKIYGKAGAYRPKPYGVEYRTPSNVWLRSKGARRFIHTLVNTCLRDMQKGAGAAFQRLAESGYDVPAIINNGDAETAEKLLREFYYITVPAAIKTAPAKAAE